MTFKSVLALAVLPLLSADSAHAQTADMAIVVSGYQLTTNGPDRPGEVAMNALLTPAHLNKPVGVVFSVTDCGTFSMTRTPAGGESFTAAEWNSYVKNIAGLVRSAVGGWRVAITPLRFSDRSVTFRVRWQRVLSSTGFQSEELELTLKLGESRPLDSILIPPHGGDGKPCDVKAASLRVSLQFSSHDRRLVGFDVWLVERLANGKEESQLQSVRGLPDHAVPFYFTSVTDGTNRYDFSGKVTTALGPEGITIEIEVMRALADPGSQSGYQAARWFRSTIRNIKPGETVAVDLAPKGQGEDLQNRNFTLRIQAKQIR